MRSRAAQGRAANFMDNYSPKEIDGSQKDDLPSFYQSDAVAPALGVIFTLLYKAPLEMEP